MVKMKVSGETKCRLTTRFCHLYRKSLSHLFQTVTCAPTSTARPVGTPKCSFASLADRASRAETTEALYAFSRKIAGIVTLDDLL